MNVQITQREDALAIWQAGVDAVDSSRLIQNAISVDKNQLTVAGDVYDLDDIGRIAVVGAGKAGAGMAAGVEAALGEQLTDEKVIGWVNVPEDCVRPLRKIHLHGARPAGINEPTAAGVDGTHRILEMVRSIGPNDLCLVLISGGGSALLPLPIDGITLEDKLAVTRLLAKSGATIQQLNTVRKQLSGIKGGKLAAAIPTEKAFAFIVSDIVGDPLDLIASGPAVPDHSTPEDALDILEQFEWDSRSGSKRQIPPRVREALQFKKTAGVAGVRQSLPPVDQDRSFNPNATGGDPAARPQPPLIKNIVVGSNAVALRAAAAEAERRGYRIHSLGSNNEGVASEVGVALADIARMTRDQSDGNGPVCILSGGEPVVKLAETDQPRKGGRNQELVLAAAKHLWDDGMSGITILSGGTDGEDGPTNAAGAVADAGLIDTAKSQNLDPDPFLAINNSYPFFEQADGLIVTGPTHTNVMDLRVVLVVALSSL
ncbi:glycerate kinase type-2 family protein [Calycomorphotria hydatis]|uniref:Hydroxypyruvate reductase n=1 Tax=Calycomorphotria hydatis TaxID=2528027 RepID=A0A517TAE9_9PLAN|nr:DUF4147 domain-containing protein [Calycomorphotria hydatis]QDT65351.1 Putative hydroxypyruvate reductase [Calycomorphotria hydatis]